MLPNDIEEVTLESHCVSENKRPGVIYKDVWMLSQAALPWKYVSDKLEVYSGLHFADKKKRGRIQRGILECAFSLIPFCLCVQLIMSESTVD